MNDKPLFLSNAEVERAVRKASRLRHLPEIERLHRLTDFLNEALFERFQSIEQINKQVVEHYASADVANEVRNAALEEAAQGIVMRCRQLSETQYCCTHCDEQAQAIRSIKCMSFPQEKGQAEQAGERTNG